MENKLCLCGCGYPTGQPNGVIRGHMVHRAKALAATGVTVTVVNVPEVMYLTVPVTIGINVAAWADEYGESVDWARKDIPPSIREIVTEAVTVLAPRRYMFTSVRVKRATVVKPTGDPVGYVPSAAVHTLVSGYVARHPVSYGFGEALVHLIMAESGMGRKDATEYAGDMITDAQCSRN